MYLLKRPGVYMLFIAASGVAASLTHRISKISTETNLSERWETKPPPSSERWETKPPPSSERWETKPPPSSERWETKPPPSSERWETKPPPSSERWETKPPPSSERWETKTPPSSGLQKGTSYVYNATLEENSSVVDNVSTLPSISPRIADISCGTHVLADGTYSIESPSYPANYPHNRDCSYTVSAASGSSIKFSCEAFNLEAHSRCQWDWLEVNNFKYCGTNGPPTSYSFLYQVEFHSDFSVARSGFRCTFTVGSSDPSPVASGSELTCGAQSLSRGSFTIKSINHPSNYVNYHACDYQLSTATAGDQLSITCSAFDLERHSSCRFDWLAVNDQKYCGTAGPNVASLQNMAISFRTDYSVVRSGFLCTVIVAEPQAPSSGNTLSCGVNQLGRGTFTIKSINHPSNYINNHDCNYQLSAVNSADSLTISCSAFSIEYHSSCAWDWLSVDGQKFCGNNGPNLASIGSMQLAFHTDYSVVRTGFMCSILVAQVVNPSPGDTLTCRPQTLARGSYTLRSMNHPSNYINNHDCNYQLSVATAGDRISLSCSAFNLEFNYACGWDWLAVNGVKYCGTNGPTSSAADSMTIEFHTDYSVVRSGFLCTIEVSDGSITPSPPTGSCTCGRVNRASRIVGGVETEVREYPWQAGLVPTGGTRTFCGGTVINNRYVLSAAHCTVNASPSGIQVLLKEHRISVSDGEMRVSISSILNHPSYTSASSSGNDVSLLKLAQTLSFPADNSLAPACMPATTSNQYVGVDAIVTGWGTTSSGGSQATALREVTVPVISNSQCLNSYSSINPTMLCAGRASGGIDSCQGDSGGPLVTLESTKYTLIGVVSWGRGCALANYPGVYARVTAVKNWILSNTADATYCS